MSEYIILGWIVEYVWTMLFLESDSSQVQIYQKYIIININ